MRKNISLSADKLDVEFMNSTLIISYVKPEEVLKEEKNIMMEIKQIKQDIEKNPEKKYGSSTQCNNQ